MLSQQLSGFEVLYIKGGVNYVDNYLYIPERPQFCKFDMPSGRNVLI